jgi:hypothetical protein
MVVIVYINGTVEKASGPKQEDQYVCPEKGPVRHGSSEVYSLQRVVLQQLSAHTGQVTVD